MKVPQPDDEQPLAWKAILEATPVHAADGGKIGTIVEVLGAENEDIFHGIVVGAGALAAETMIPAEKVTRITNRRIEVSLTAEEIRALPPYVPEESYKLGMVGLLGRTLGWVRDDGRGAPQ